MPMKLTLTFPLPPDDLSPNARVHYLAKARAAATYRKSAKLLSRSKLNASGTSETWFRFLEEEPQLRLTETYRIAGKRKRDVRNLFAAFKAGEDGLVDAGIIPGDDDSVLEHGAPKIERVASKKDEGILVVIEAVV